MCGAPSTAAGVVGMSDATDGVPADLGGTGRTFEIGQVAPEDDTQVLEVRAGPVECAVEVPDDGRTVRCDPARAEAVAATTWAMAGEPGGPTRTDAEAFADSLREWAEWASDDIGGDGDE